MHTLIFASSNHHKIKEVQQVLPANIKIISAAEAGITEDIPETGNTLEANAKLKALYVFERTGKNCFADDTGLEVDALNGEPGVYSARYASEQKNSEDNIKKLLKILTHSPSPTERGAKFKTIISLYFEKEYYEFEGIIEGIISHEPLGRNGFGYDPVFIPEGHTKTFAEMTDDEKNVISHRTKAVEKLVAFLRGNS